jgi:hypothetical protein
MYKSSRYLFDSLDAAVEALLVVLEDARITVHSYRFGSLSADQVYASGLMLIGEIDEVCVKLDEIEGAHGYMD